MTLLTARSLGFGGAVENLLDPKVNAYWAAKLISELNTRHKGHLADIAAAYNSGKPYVCAPLVTRLQYVPNILKYASEYGNPYGF